MNTRITITAIVVFSGIFLIAVLNKANKHHPLPEEETFAIEKISAPSWVSEDYYQNNIQPILDAKCIACHACYNAPCQLNLTNYQGIARGANQVNPYRFQLTVPRKPAHIGLGDHTMAEWRKFGFYDVIGDPEHSLLLSLLTQHRGRNYSQHIFNAETSRICSQPGILSKVLVNALDELSMPYGLPKLSAQEIEIFQKWISAGAPGPSDPVQRYLKSPRSSRVINEIEQWEDMLNADIAKNKLSARYLYEHLFIGHIAFFPNSNEFFRLVRASNRTGVPSEITTARAIDSPGEKFYYRFKVVNQSLVSKTHSVFLLDEKEKKRFKEGFLSDEWQIIDEELPGYDANSANAFVTFAKIPRKTRYRFFIDNARYFVMTFIKGPVCRGQTALNVINDHFWVFFVDPEFDLSANLDDKFNQFAHLLSPPAFKKNHVGVFNELRKNRWQAHVNKMSQYRQRQAKFSLQTLWNGDGHNPNAALTVFREFDSADVLFGARGEFPKTIWLMDYQIFEDIYYNLVAGYYLGDTLAHQLNTRLYMELSRVTSEDMFITLLPEHQRESIRYAWNQDAPEMAPTIIGELVQLAESHLFEKIERNFSYQGNGLQSLVSYSNNDKLDANEAQKTLLQQILNNRLPAADDIIFPWDHSYYSQEAGFDKWLKSHFSPLIKLTGPFPEIFPDAVLIRIKQKEGEQKNIPRIVTMFYNKEHYNVNMLFLEDLRRHPERDTFSFISGIGTSYPNFYLEVDAQELPSFIEQLEQALTNPSQTILLENFFKTYGVSRFSADFWEKHHWFNDQYRQERPIEFGVLALNRYSSR